MADKTRWYHPSSGEIVYEIMKADGKGMTKPTLVHARKFGFLPSVTSVLKALAKSGGLDDWLINQRILACISNPFEGDVNDEARVKEYMAMINIKASEYGKDTADRGTYLHGEVSQWVRSEYQYVSPDPAGKNMCLEFGQYFAQNNVVTVSTETNIASPELGYAGTPDLFCVCQDGSEIVIDLKTADFEGKKLKPYESWLFQLGAYRNLKRAENARLVQAVGDRTHGDLVMMDHDESVINYSDAFNHLFEVWVALKKYDPRKFSE